jgi:hypothetical protein
VLQVLGGRNGATRPERIDLREQLGLDLRVAGDEVHGGGERERRGGRPGEEVLVGERAHVVRRQQLPQRRAAVPGVEHRGQKVPPRSLAVAATFTVARPRRHDLVDARAQPLVGPRDPPVGRPRDAAQQAPRRPLQRRRDEAERDGERRGQVHLEGGGGVYVLPDELRGLAGATARREAEVDAERRLPDDVGGQLEGEVGEVDVAVVLSRRRYGVRGALDAALHGGDEAGEVRRLVQRDDRVPHLRPPFISDETRAMQVLKI